MSKRRDSEKDIELQIGRDVRRIMREDMPVERAADLSEPEYEKGPQLIPGMEEKGIGSVISRGTLYDDPDLPDDFFFDDDDEEPDEDRFRNATGRRYRAYPDDAGVYDAGAYDGAENPGASGKKTFPGAGNGSGGNEGRNDRVDDSGNDGGNDRADYGGDDVGNDGGNDDGGDGEDGSGEFQPRGPYLFISIAFGLIFLLLIVHLIYFNLEMKDDILNSPYNKRQNLQSEHVVRGRILSADGATLAVTKTNDEGEEYRSYPFANVFAHVVGFASHGKSGIEQTANYMLLTSHTNIIDQVINEFLKKKNQGDDVITTLNSSLQEAAYHALGDYRGAVIVMNPKTGAILSMVSKPDFDPNTISYVWDDMVSDSTSSQLVNRATQGLYPPGSTFKIITATSYYREHHTFEGFEYNCTGEFEIEDSIVHCYKGAVHGIEDFKSAFAHSCNTAFSQVGLDLGANRLTAAAKSLLFGEAMPIDLYSSKSRWSLTEEDGDVMLVQTAFGQGKTLVTPFHMALIVSAIANKGVLMNPYLIERVENSSGKTVSQAKPSVYRTLFTGEEAAALTDLMVAVVEEGSASELSWLGIPAAGKTGSAEYVRKDGTIGTHSWFVGFMHPDDPDLVIAVIAEDGGAGSTTAVPIASSILEAFY